MRRIFSLCLAAVLLLAGCTSAPADPAADPQPVQILAAMYRSQAAPPPVEVRIPTDSAFFPYLQNYYGLEPEWVDDGALCYAGGAQATELAVLRLSADAPDDLSDALSAYPQRRAGDFAGYVPDQAKLAEEGQVLLQGNWVCLAICYNSQDALEAFQSAFRPSWRPPDPEDVFSHPFLTPSPTPSPTLSPPFSNPEPTPYDPSDDPYDHDAVLSAYRSKTPETLSPKNRAIYDACQEVLSACITPGMAPWEQELAIHDYMTAHGSYDYATLANFSDDADPDNDNPYGFLVHGLGICEGYSSTFQLFMDILNIPCITVQGANLAREEHAWNMVQLDGEWYCVDVTWDDPASSSPNHYYFNITTQTILLDHLLYTTDAPKARGTEYSWANIANKQQ